MAFCIIYKEIAVRLLKVVSHFLVFVEVWNTKCLQSDAITVYKNHNITAYKSHGNSSIDLLMSLFRY